MHGERDPRDRYGAEHAVDAVQDAAVSWQQGARVLHADPPLELRFGEVSQLRAHADEQACQRGEQHTMSVTLALPLPFGRQGEQPQSSEHACCYQAAEQSCPPFVGADALPQFRSAQRLSSEQRRRVEGDHDHDHPSHPRNAEAVVQAHEAHAQRSEAEQSYEVVQVYIALQ